MLCIANTDPVNDRAAVTLDILSRATSTHPHGPFVHPVAAATVGLEGKELAPLGELKEAGCIAVSNDGRPLANSEILRRVMEYGADLGLMLIDHCEDPWLARGSHMNEGDMSGMLGMRGQPTWRKPFRLPEIFFWRNILIYPYI